MKKNNEMNNIVIALLIFIFYPFGLFYMWATQAFSKKTRWIITWVFIGAIIIGLSALIFLTSAPGYID